jgi:hypothetical protein
MYDQSDLPPSRGLTLWALAAGVVLVVALGGPGAMIGETRRAIQQGQARPLAAGPYSAAQTGAILRAAPPAYSPPPVAPPAPAMRAGGAPAADPLACVDGVNSYGIACGPEPDGTHYYPPAHPDQPCRQPDGAVRFTRIDATGNTSTFRRAPQYSADGTTYTVVLLAPLASANVGGSKRHPPI